MLFRRYFFLVESTPQTIPNQPQQTTAPTPFWQIIIITILTGAVGVSILDKVWEFVKIKWLSPQEDWDMTKDHSREIYNILNELKSRTDSIKVHIIEIANINKIVTHPSDVTITMLAELYDGQEGITRYWQHRQVDDGTLGIIKSILDNGHHIQIIKDIDKMSAVRTDLQGWLFYAMISHMIAVTETSMFMVSACYDEGIDEYEKFGAVKLYAQLLKPLFEKKK